MIRFGILEDNYNGFWGALDTAHRYISHVGYGLTKLGHDVTWYPESNRIQLPDPLKVRPRSEFSLGDVDIILTTPERFTDLPKPTYIVYEAIEFTHKRPCISAYFGPRAQGHLVPQYIPPKPIDIPFDDRKHRFFVATPTDDIYTHVHIFHEPIGNLRMTGFPYLITHNRNISIQDIVKQSGNNKKVNRYIQMLYMAHNNYFHTYIDWREHMFQLAACGIYCRYSWFSHKTAITEALAYGNAVVLTHTHSTPYYDLDDVILIEHSSDYDTFVKEQEDTISRVESTFRTILTDPYQSDRSEELSQKYTARHSIEKVMGALELINWEA